MNLSKEMFAVMYVAPNGSPKWILCPDMATAQAEAERTRILGWPTPLIFKAQTVHP